MLQLRQHHSLLSVRSLCLHGPQKKCWVDGSAKEQAATEPPKAPPRSSAASLAASSGPNSNEATGPSTAVDSGPGSAGTADGRYAVALRQFLLLCPRCMHCTLCCQCQADWRCWFCSILGGQQLCFVLHSPSAPLDFAWQSCRAWLRSCCGTPIAALLAEQCL